MLHFGGATMIPSLIGTLCSTPAQDTSIPTTTQISHHLAFAHCLHAASRIKYSSSCDAVSNSLRFGQHCQTVSKKKPFCVKCELRTKSCTQSETPRISRCGMAIRSRLIINFSPRVEGQRTIRAVT